MGKKTGVSAKQNRLILQISPQKQETHLGRIAVTICPQRKTSLWEKRTVPFGFIRGLICYFIFALGILLTLSIEVEADPCKGATPDEQMRMKIAEKLFKVTNVTEVTGIPPKDVKWERSVKYNHNGYGCNWDGDPYLGSHAGWDVVFYSKSPKFYSLTSGKVLANGRDENGKLFDCSTNARTIAIYDEHEEVATLYLHAKNVNLEVERGEYIKYGAPLGLQGDCGKNVKGAHVHIEVRKLRSPEDLIESLAVASHGTADEKRPTIPPIQYLHDSIESHSLKGIRILTWAWALLRGQK